MGLIKSKNGMIKSKKGSIFKNRILISVILLAVAAAIAFFILPKLYQDQERIITVLQASVPIGKGEVITGDKVTLKKVGAFGMQPDVLEAAEDAIGKVANVDILTGDNITGAKLGEGDPILEEYAKGGKQLVSISLNSNAAGLSGHLQKGDIVNLMLIRETETEYQTSFKMEERSEFKNLEVYDIENARAESISVMQGSNSLTPVNEDRIAKTVTFIATDAQAKALVEAEYSGEFHVIFVRKGA